MDCEQFQSVQRLRHADGGNICQIRHVHGIVTSFRSSWTLTSTSESHGPRSRQPTCCRKDDQSHLRSRACTPRQIQPQYDHFTLEFDKKLFIESADSFRHQLTGGIRPQSQENASEQKRELLRLNLTHVFHEIYCKLKENFPPLPSFSKILTEQAELL